MSSEHRVTNRIRSFLRGEIVHSNGNSRTECTVRDLSETGARIEAPVSVTIPETFELYIPQKNSRQKAKMVWRQGAEIGVTFVNQQAAPAPAGSPSAPAQPASEEMVELRMRVLELEVETARLKAQLLEMRVALDNVLRETGRDRRLA